jgi:hypothetical protein
MPSNRPSNRILLLIFGVFTVGLLGIVTVGSLPGVCASCHAMRPYARTLSTSAHAKVSCYSCHLSSSVWDWPRFKMTELVTMYPAAFLGRDVKGQGRRVSRDACLRCHADVQDHTVRLNGLAISHARCVSSTTGCDTCHNVHGSAARWTREAVMEDCVLCHEQKSAPKKCDACHLQHGQRERLAKGPWQVTHGANWRQTHGLGSIQSCAECHSTQYCARCHHIPLPHPPGFAKTHGTESLRPGVVCTSCHDRAGFCDACHQVPMPHPADFLAKHPKAAKSFTDPTCINCHQQPDCDNCHVKHTHPGYTRGTLGKNLPVVKP